MLNPVGSTVKVHRLVCTLQGKPMGEVKLLGKEAMKQMW